MVVGVWAINESRRSYVSRNKGKVCATSSKISFEIHKVLKCQPIKIKETECEDEPGVSQVRQFVTTGCDKCAILALDFGVRDPS